jgi:hypothetical protein
VSRSEWKVVTVQGTAGEKHSHTSENERIDDMTCEIGRAMLQRLARQAHFSITGHGFGLASCRRPDFGMHFLQANRHVTR